MKCVAKIHDRAGCTFLVYCHDESKQFFFNFSEKCPTSALWRVVL